MDFGLRVSKISIFIVFFLSAIVNHRSAIAHGFVAFRWTALKPFVLSDLLHSLSFFCGHGYLYTGNSSTICATECFI